MARSQGFLDFARLRGHSEKISDGFLVLVGVKEIHTYHTKKSRIGWWMGVFRQKSSDVLSDWPLRNLRRDFE